MERVQENNWNKLSEAFYVDHNAIGYPETAFYGSILRNTVDRLVESGVMKYLLKTYLFPYRSVPKTTPDPNVLSVEDLAFGFNIFIAFCGISGIIFAAELILGIKICRTNLSFDDLRRKLKFRKVKFAKVHPMNTIVSLICIRNHKLTPALLKKFKIKKNYSKIDTSVEFFKIIVAEVHRRMDSEDELRVFDGKIADFDDELENDMINCEEIEKIVV